MKSFYNPTTGKAKVTVLGDTHYTKSLLYKLNGAEMEVEIPYNNLGISLLEIKKEIGLPLSAIEEFILLK